MIRLPQSGLDRRSGPSEALDLPLAHKGQPFLELRCCCPKGHIRTWRMLAAIGDKPVRLARITTSYPGLGPGGWRMVPRQRRLDGPLPHRRCFASAISVSSTGSRQAELVASFEEITWSR